VRVLNIGRASLYFNKDVITQNPEQEESSGDISYFKWEVRDLDPDRDADIDLLFPGISSATPCSFQDIISILSQ
jgi:hypothetical protein